MSELDPSNTGGRRKIRCDLAVMNAAFQPTVRNTMKVIKLGPIEGSILRALIEEYLAHGPVDQVTRDKISARHSDSTPGIVFVDLLRRKGAVISDKGDTQKDKDVIPVVDGVIYVDSRTRERIWPVEEVPPEQVPTEDGPDMDVKREVMGAQTPPLQLKSSAQVKIYGRLLARQRQNPDQAFTCNDLYEDIEPEGVLAPWSMVHRLHTLGMIERVGKVSSNTDGSGGRPQWIYKIIFRSYQPVGGEVVIPPECMEVQREEDESDGEDFPETPTEVKEAAPRLRTKEEIAHQIEEVRTQAGQLRVDLLNQRLAELTEHEAELNRERETLELRLGEIKLSLGWVASKREALSGGEETLVCSEAEVLEEKTERLRQVLENYDLLVTNAMS